jgi:hypothetical protein
MRMGIRPVIDVMIWGVPVIMTLMDAGSNTAVKGC